MAKGENDSDQPQKWEVPGYTDAFRDRLITVIESLGGIKRAAELIDLTYPTLAAWRDGKTPPRLFELDVLTRKAGRSITWLLNGQAQGSNTPGGEQLDHELLQRVALYFEETIRAKGLKFPPHIKAEMLVQAFANASRRQQSGETVNLTDVDMFFDLIND